MDLNHDGVLSQSEFTDAVAQLSFDTYDRNHDGFIDPAEWRALEQGNDALFRARDLSGNGRITRQEARLAAEKNKSLLALLATIDTNHDGVIDRAEAMAYQATLKTPRR
jgi:Ca2+-binding EF-hand superfamily protein